MGALQSVAVAAGDRAVVDGDQAVVRDGNAVDLAPEVAEQVLRLGGGALGIDHPVVPMQAEHQPLEGGGVGQLRRSAAEGAVGAQALQPPQEVGAEYR